MASARAKWRPNQLAARSVTWPRAPGSGKQVGGAGNDGEPASHFSWVRTRWIPRLEQALADVTLALEEQELADSARLRLAAGRRGVSSRA